VKSYLLVGIKFHGFRSNKTFSCALKFMETLHYLICVDILIFGSAD